MAILQVALDLIDLPRALTIAKEAVEGGADWIEAGTPLIKSEGLEAVRALRKLIPGATIVADMKIADTGGLEVEIAAKSGADIICILAGAGDEVIREAVQAAKVFGVRLMADLLYVQDPVGRARRLEELGVDIIIAHVGIDQQMVGVNSPNLAESIIGTVSIPIAVAGGLDLFSAQKVVLMGADIVIIGGAITRVPDVVQATREIRDAIDKPQPVNEDIKSHDESIRELLLSVSTPNVSDAMHRKGAMEGIFPIYRGVKAAGKAITVHTIGGDWAKPVEAIDHARNGDFIVINNDGCTNIAPWGELATLSCMRKGVVGVVIDGAVRDVDDIRSLKFPLFAKATVPNAGEPKGYGEINAEITCCGQTVRPGDWILGDESGVVVIPKEYAYEIARRSVEVKKTESRIREEIKRGKTLGEIADLLRWEKH